MTKYDRIAPLVDERLFEAFWGAVEHFGTTDLVVFFETERDVDPVDVLTREGILKNPNASDFLRAKVAKQPGAASVPGASPTTFWFVAVFPDETIVTAVTARRIGNGGAA